MTKMGSVVSKIADYYKQGDVCRRFICWNVFLFLLYSVLNVLFVLFKWSDSVRPISYFELPSSLSLFLHRPWTLITYMFLHAGILHILFNMLWLYWFGQMFLQSFSARHFIGLYFLGGIVGGLFYMVAYNLFPYFEEVVDRSFLIGASASVLAIVAATAVRNPDRPVLLLLIGAVKLKYIAIASVLLSFLLIDSSNAGGNIAHLGGAFMGWLFAHSLNRGCDLTAWINFVFTFFAKTTLLLSGKRVRKSKMKVHMSDRQKDYEYNARRTAQEERINRILEKLRRSGYPSLTEEEKKTLFDAGKR